MVSGEFVLYLRFISRLWTISECKVHCKKTYAIAACLYCIVFIDVAFFTQNYRHLVLTKNGSVGKNDFDFMITRLISEYEVDFQFL